MMELDEALWQMFKDQGKTIRSAAEEALQQIGRNATIEWTRIAHRRGSGMVDGECVEVWCVKIVDVDEEIRICREGRAPRADMLRKLADSFVAIL